MLLTERHLILSEQLVKIVNKSLGSISQVYRILCFKLSYYLLRKYIVKRVKLVASAADIYGNIGVDLLPCCGMATSSQL